MDFRKVVIPIALVLTVVMVAPFAFHPAEAHILKTFNMTGSSMPGMPSAVSVKIGWLHEPPLAGDLNQIDVYVYNGTNEGAPPISDTGLDNMTVTVQYGGKVKTLDFAASDDLPGLYVAAITPDQVGTYNVIIKGNIGGVTIQPTTYVMQDVESKDKYYFPPLNGQSLPGQTNTATNSPTTTNQAVPEFGPVASLVLVVAIVSVIVMTGRIRGFPKI